MRSEDRDREAACFRLLRELRGCEFVLIGGYAVSAYGPPRFSVDLDLVLPLGAVVPIRRILRKTAMTRMKAWDGGGVFQGRAERWTLGSTRLPVAVDLLIGGVYDRVSKASHTYEDLREGSSILGLRGLDPDSTAETRVASREALLALKIEAGRKVDLRDVTVLAAGPVRPERIEALFTGADRGVVLEHLQQLEAASLRRDFIDSLNGVYMLDDRGLQAMLVGATRLAHSLRRRLEGT